MILDALVIAVLIYIFARYNAEGGLLRCFLMLIGVLVVTIIAMIALPEALLILTLPIFVILLAAGITFICGTQPRQTGKIIASFLAFRLCMWGLATLLQSGD